MPPTIRPPPKTKAHWLTLMPRMLQWSEYKNYIHKYQAPNLSPTITIKALILSAPIPTTNLQSNPSQPTQTNIKMEVLS